MVGCIHISLIYLMTIALITSTNVLCGDLPTIGNKHPMYSKIIGCKIIGIVLSQKLHNRLFELVHHHSYGGTWGFEKKKTPKKPWFIYFMWVYWLGAFDSNSDI